MTTKDKRIYEMADHLLLQVAVKNESFPCILDLMEGQSLRRFQVPTPFQYCLIGACKCLPT